MCIWEGAADWYRDMTHHGGILCTFWANWYDMQVKTVQLGAASAARAAALRAIPFADRKRFQRKSWREIAVILAVRSLAHPLDDDYHKARSPVWSRSRYRFATAGNWGRQGSAPAWQRRRLRRAASREDGWSCTGWSIWTHFYTDDGRLLQKRFFDYFLKGTDNGWADEPQVRLQIATSTASSSAWNKWPIARTRWTKLYLNPADQELARLSSPREGRIDFDATGDGVTFLSPPLEQERKSPPFGGEALRLVFNDRCGYLRCASRLLPDEKEIVFQGAIDPHTPRQSGLAPRLASEARSCTEHSLQAVSHPR